MTARWLAVRAPRFAAALATVGGVALLLRIALLTVAMSRGGQLLTPDGDQYVAIAHNLAQHGTFSASDAPPLLPTMARAPGYPIWLAGTLLLAGGSPTALWPAFAGQLLLGAAVVCLVGWLARFVLPDRWALGVAALCAVSPGELAHSVMLSSEMPFGALLLAALGCLFILRRGGRWQAAAAAGGLLGLAMLTRPIGLFLPLGLAPVAALRDPAHGRIRLAPVGVLLGTAIIVCLPWVVRNQARFGVPFVSAAEGDVLMAYDAASFLARRDGVPLDTARAELQRNAQALAGIPPGQSIDARTESRLAVRVILGHPFAYAWYHARMSLNSLMPSVTELTEVAGITSGRRGTMTVLADSGAAIAVSHYTGLRTGLAGVVAAGLYLLIAVGTIGTVLAAALLARWRDWASAWLLTVPVVLLVFTTGPAAHPRLSVPIWGPLLVLWAAGWRAAWTGPRFRGTGMRMAGGGCT